MIPFQELRGFYSCGSFNKQTFEKITVVFLVFQYGKNIYIKKNSSHLSASAVLSVSMPFASQNLQ